MGNTYCTVQAWLSLSKYDEYVNYLQELRGNFTVQLSSLKLSWR